MCLAGAFSAARAAPSIKALSEAPNDGPIKYTVKMVSKDFGSDVATRTIRSGQSDDFTWQYSAARGAQPVPEQCTDAASIPRNAEGAAVRQVQIRLTPIVADNGMANVQINFRGYSPRGSRTVNVNGTALECPSGAQFSQVVRFAMSSASGSRKTVVLDDGTELTVSTNRK